MYQPLLLKGISVTVDINYNEDISVFAVNTSLITQEYMDRMFDANKFMNTQINLQRYGYNSNEGEDSLKLYAQDYHKMSRQIEQERVHLEFADFDWIFKKDNAE